MLRTKVVGYVRVSTDEQANEGVSLDVQCDKLAQYAALHDLELIASNATRGSRRSRSTVPAFPLRSAD